MKTQEIIDIEDKYFINTFNNRKLLILKINILLIHSTESLSYLTMEKALKYGILRAMSIWTSWQE